ncbi:ArnT family glycosyltransferase [Acidobacteriota bacterium]
MTNSTQTGARRYSRAFALSMAFILAFLAFAYAFAVYSVRFKDEPFRADSRDYYFLAGNLCYNQIFSADEDDPEPTAYRPPLYPLLLSLILKTFGYVDFPFAARILQFFFFACSVFVLFLLCLEQFGARTAILAALLHGFYFPLVFSAMQLTLEPLAVFLLSLFLFSLQKWTRNRNLLMAALAGCLLGLAGLARPNVLILLPLSILWVILCAKDQHASILRQHQRTHTLRQVVVFIVFVFVAIMPWTIRNYRALGGFCLISTNGGSNFHIGHHPDFDPSLHSLKTDYGAFQRLKDEGYSEIEADRQLYRKGLNYMLSHPLQEIRRIPLKIRTMMTNYTPFLNPWLVWIFVIAFALFLYARRYSLLLFTGLLFVLFVAAKAWVSVPRSDALLLPATSFILLYPLAVFGIPFAAKKRCALILLLSVWFLILSTGLLYIPMVRIRWSVDIIAAILAARGIDGLISITAPCLARKKGPP